MRLGSRWSRWAAGLALCGCGVVDHVRDPYASAPLSAERPWTPPPDMVPAPSAVPGRRITPDPAPVYDVPALIALAQPANPAPRPAWEQPRAGAPRPRLAGRAGSPGLGRR